MKHFQPHQSDSAEIMDVGLEGLRSLSAARDLIDRQISQLTNSFKALQRLETDFVGVRMASKPLLSGSYALQTKIAVLKQVIRARRDRTRIIDEGLFCDTSWDILLDLYSVHLAQSRTSISSVCYGSSSPPTTALRHIKVLESRGYVVRHPDPMDGRRVYLQLSESGLAKMDSYFDHVGIVPVV